MADPATLAIASLAVSAIGAGVTTAGTISQGQANKSAAAYQAQVARNNQTIAQQNAQQAAQAGSVSAQARDFANRQRTGAILAGQAASGIDIESGSSQEVRKSSEELGRLDTATVMANALNTARSYSTQAENFGAQAGLDTLQARNASTAGYLTGGASLIGGASSFADKWLRYQTTGVTGFTSP